MSFLGVKYYVMQAGPAPVSEGCGEVEKDKEVEEPLGREKRISRRP